MINILLKIGGYSAEITLIVTCILVKISMLRLLVALL